jgi:hypothetical protein
MAARVDRAPDAVVEEVVARLLALIDAGGNRQVG